MANQSPAFPQYPQGLAPPPDAPPQYELGSNRYSNSSPPQPSGLTRNDMEGRRPSVEKPAPGAPAGAQQWQQAGTGAGAGAQAHMGAAVPAPTAPPGAPVADPFQPAVTPNQAGEDSSEAAYYNAQRCLLLRLGESIIGRAYESPRDCKAGLLRNTVCATNLRLILNTHFRFLCMAKRDFHESVFYELQYNSFAVQGFLFL